MQCKTCTRMGIVVTKKNQTLTSFGKSSLALAKLLKEGEKLDTDDQTFIENHFLIVQLAYSAWKLGHQKK